MREKCHLVELREDIWVKLARATVGGLLFPAYRLVFKLRRARFLRKRSPLPGLPVVAVGGLAMGGAGKTPLTLALWQTLLQQDWRGGVVLKMGRPAGAYFDEFALYLNALAAAGGGQRVRIERQKASIFARSGTGFVLAHRNKLAALEWLASTGNFQFALVDDGFQLYSLKPSLNVCVVRAEDWQSRAFPLGPLREEPAALARADIVLLRVASSAETGAEPVPPSVRKYPRLVLRPLGLLPARELARPWLHDEGTPEAAASGPEAELPTGAALAFSGIGHAQEFEQFVFATHADTSVCIRFGDHHCFSTLDLRMLHQQMKAHGCRFFLTTEKDACRLLPHMLRALHARGHELNWPKELLPAVRHFTPDFTVELEALWDRLFFLKLAAEVPGEAVRRLLESVRDGIQRSQ